MRDYEGLARDAIEAGHEGPKVDFKERIDFECKKDVVDLAKLVLAMANTDSDEFEDLGIVIVGARRREIVGGCDRFGDDSFCASLPTRLNRYIDPEARIEAKGFRDLDKGWFGAIIIKPARTVRPHFIAKEFTDEKRVVVRRNECYVRRGESVELASRSDFERMYAQRFGDELDRLRDLADPEPSPHLSWADFESDGGVELPPRGMYSEPSLDDPFSPEELAELPPGEREKGLKFNEARAAYLDAARDAGPALAASYMVEHHSHQLWITLRNGGEAPLLNPTCLVSAPAEFEVYDDSALPRMPDLPPRPHRPRLLRTLGPAQGLFDTIQRMNDIYRLGLNVEVSTLHDSRPAFRLPNPHSGGFRLDGPHRFSAWAKRLKHGFALTWDDPIIVVPPAAEGVHSLEYEIHADNLRSPRKGRLELRVRAGADRKLHRAKKDA